MIARSPDAGGRRQGDPGGRRQGDPGSRRHPVPLFLFYFPCPFWVEIMSNSERPPLTVARLRIVSSSDQPAPKPSQPAPKPRPSLPSDRLYIPRVDVDVLAPVIHLPGEAWAVFLAIQFEVAVKKDRSIKLGNRILWKHWRVSPAAKRHGLQALEKAGLIKIDQQSGHSPVVTLVDRG
jgi:hypothetical protein